MLQAWAPVGMHKYHSFMEYVQLYPEYDFIFLGDNGQGDAMCADRVIEKAGESSLSSEHECLISLHFWYDSIFSHFSLDGCSLLCTSSSCWCHAALLHCSTAV